MPFYDKPDKPFKTTAGPHDLFYGLAKPRDALMKHLGVSEASQDGHKINYYDVGDVAQGRALPTYSAEFKKWLGQHDKYKVGVDAGKYLWPHWRVKSKGGLEWATGIKGIDVHFCLDGMVGDTHFAIPMKCWDDEEGFDSAEYASGGSKWLEKTRAITNAELRWIYRNQNKPGVQQFVQFWQDNKPCGPPWERPELKPFWSAYKPSSWST